MHKITVKEITKKDAVAKYGTSELVLTGRSAIGQPIAIVGGGYSAFVGQLFELQNEADEFIMHTKAAKLTGLTETKGTLFEVC